MKPSFLSRVFVSLFIGITVMAAVAVAADDTIEFYVDAAMLSCELSDLTPGLVQVHMFHMGSLPATSISFAAPPPACWVGATWLGDIIVPEFLPGGNTTQGPLGILVNYLDCLTPPQYLGYMNFAASGAAESCCSYGPSDPPGSDDPMAAYDCWYVGRRTVTGRPIVINADETCRCISPVPVEQTSWGRVKALYTE